MPANEAMMTEADFAFAPTECLIKCVPHLEARGTAKSSDVDAGPFSFLNCQFLGANSIWAMSQRHTNDNAITPAIP